MITEESEVTFSGDVFAVVDVPSTKAMTAPQAKNVIGRIRRGGKACRTCRTHFRKILNSSLQNNDVKWLALDNIGWTRTERSSCFPKSLTSFSSSFDRNKCNGLWRPSTNLCKGCSLCYCDGIYGQVLLFVCSMNHIQTHLFLSRADDNDVRDIGKDDFCWFYFTLCHVILTA